MKEKVLFVLPKGTHYTYLGMIDFVLDESIYVQCVSGRYAYSLFKRRLGLRHYSKPHKIDFDGNKMLRIINGKTYDVFNREVNYER